MSLESRRQSGCLTRSLLLLVLVFGVGAMLLLAQNTEASLAAPSPTPSIVFVLTPTTLPPELEDPRPLQYASCIVPLAVGIFIVTLAVSLTTGTRRGRQISELRAVIRRETADCDESYSHIVERERTREKLDKLIEVRSKRGKR